MKHTIIRSGVYETNSSSTHSISISDAGLLNDLPEVDKNGTVTIEPDDFGWEERSYYDVGKKLSYLMIYCRDWAREKSEIYFSVLESVIREMTKCENVIFDCYEKSDYGYDDGYIDHQSVESGDLDYLFESPEEMKKFLFNDRSYLETDNDNH